MSKQLYIELQEAFENLKKTEAEKIYDAVENHEFPPVPFTLPTVMKTINEVIRNHTTTKEELIETLTLNASSLSPEDMQAIKKIIEEYENKSAE